MENDYPWILAGENIKEDQLSSYFYSKAHTDRVKCDARQDQLSFTMGELLPCPDRSTLGDKITICYNKKMLNLPSKDSDPFVGEIHGYQLRYILLNPALSKPEKDAVLISSWLSTGKIQNILVKLTTFKDAVALVEAGRRLMYATQQEKMVKIKRFVPLMMKQLRVSVTPRDLVYEDKWCILDEEVFMILQSERDPTATDVFRFYLEPGSEVIDEIKLNLQSKVTLCTTPNECIIDLKYSSEDTKESFVKCLRSMGPKSKQIFTDAFMYEEYLNSKLVTKEPKVKEPRKISETRVDHKDEDLSKPMKSINLSGPDLTNKNTDAVPEELQIMWAVAESECTEIIAKGLVPGSSINSGGLDPNSSIHFRKCVEEITEAIYNQQYDVALSHVRGIREVFRFSCVGLARKLLSIQDDLDLLRYVFFNF